MKLDTYQPSEWNDAGATSMRMHSAWVNMAIAQLTDDLPSWFTNENILLSELLTDFIKDKTKTKVGEKEMTRLEYINALRDEIRKGINSASYNDERGRKVVDQHMVDLLEKYEWQLRIIHDKAGFKTKRGVDVRFKR